MWNWDSSAYPHTIWKFNSHPCNYLAFFSCMKAYLLIKCIIELFFLIFFSWITIMFVNFVSSLIFYFAGYWSKNTHGIIQNDGSWCVPWYQWLHLHRKGSMYCDKIYQLIIDLHCWMFFFILLYIIYSNLLCCIYSMPFNVSRALLSYFGISWVVSDCF